MSNNIQASGIDLDHIMDKFGQTTNTINDKLTTLTESVDTGSPEDLLEFQHAINQFSLATEMQSSVMKTLKDLLRGIIQKST